MNKQPTPVVIRVPSEVKETLEAYAKANDLTLSQVTRKALREFIQRLQNESAK